MSQTRTILIIDDDDDLREVLREQFELYDSFSIEEAANASDGINIAKKGDADIILLDVELPDMDGRDACKLMRAKDVKVPIVMLTGRDGDADEILGLDSGANDYVTKPFKFSVLLSRIRAHLRSFEQSEDASFKVGPYEFKASAKTLTTPSGDKIRLTEKETNIIRYLLKSGGKPVPREELLTEVWGYNAQVTTHTLETHIYRLRQKIEADSALGRILVTESGGYRLQL